MLDKKAARTIARLNQSWLETAARKLLNAVDHSRCHNMTESADDYRAAAELVTQALNIVNAIHANQAD